jgi:hypothetical protein
MKVTQLILPLSLLAAVPIGMAFSPASEKLDLSPRFEEGQTITIAQTFKADGALDELSVLVNGAPMMDGSGFTADMEVDGTIEMTENIVALREGEIAKVHVTMDTMDVAVTGEFEAQGEGDSIDESMETELVGRTIAISVDEDGDVTREDITEGEDPIDELEMAGLTYQNHFEMLLPKEPVEEGVAFELAPDWKELVMDAMSGMDSADMGEEERAAAEGFMNAFVDATTVEATGKVTGVEDGVATIEYELSATMTIDDLVSLIKSIAPPGEMDQVPPGIESMIEATAEFSGTGTFDMNVGQMTSLDLAGDFEMSASGEMDMDGTAASASILMSGSMEVAATLTVE